MPSSTPRTRLIFQNVNVSTGPAATSGNTATGGMYTSGNSGDNLIVQLANVLSANLNVGINRQDLNILGQLNRVGQIIISPPDISMDFTYNVTDGYNEKMLGFDIKGNSFLSGILTKESDSKNFFLSISQQGVDDSKVSDPNQRDVYAIGNAFISNYTFNAAVGQVPTANVTVDGLNVVPYTGSSGLQTPAVDPVSSARITQWQFQLPPGQIITGEGDVFALRPGDVSLEFPNGVGFLVPMSGAGSINVQSFSLSVPISRDVLNRLGSPFGFSREIRFPVNVNLQLQALQTEVGTTSFDQLYCNDQSYDCRVVIRKPACAGVLTDAAIILGFNGAKLANISHGFTVGGDASVSLSLTAQLAGATSTDGVTFSGYY